MISMNNLFLLFFVQNIASCKESSGCPNGWIDGSLASMGCLYFNHSQPLTWFEAAQSCQQGQTGAKLIEILTSEVRLPIITVYQSMFSSIIFLSKWTSLRWIFSFSKHRSNVKMIKYLLFLKISGDKR